MAPPCTVTSDVLIAAPPQAVWTILLDFPRYPDWNPFIRRIEGPPEPGGRLDFVFRIHPGLTLSAEGRLHRLEEARALSWTGHAGDPRLLSVEHWFVLDPQGAGTRLVQGENFFGAGASGWTYLFARLLRRAYDDMNQALKALAEAR